MLNAFARLCFPRTILTACLTLCLIVIGGIAAAASPGIASAQAYTDTLPNGVASGDVTGTSAVLWARSTAAGTVTFEVAADPTFNSVLMTRSAEADDPLIPVKVSVEGLTPGTEYHYRVTNAAGESLSGRFVTPYDEGSHGLRFGVTGDWRGELLPYVSIRNVAKQQLDFFVEHGDTIYADFPSPAVPAGQATTLEDYRRKHAEVYSAVEGIDTLADVRASTSIFAMIDDHEVTNDFAGGAAPSTDSRFAGSDGVYINQTPLYRTGLQVFREYNPIRDEEYASTGDPRFDGVPNLYRAQTYGTDAAIFLVDARSFRDAEIAAISPLDALLPFRLIPYLARFFEPGRTFLGQTQLAALERDLLAAQQGGITWKFILLPEPMQNMGWLGGNDRWESDAPERSAFMRFVGDHQIANVVFVSADVHTTFINNITYQTEAAGETIPTGAFEISTGSVAFYPPTGEAMIEAAKQFKLMDDETAAAYDAAATIQEKDALLQDLFNSFILERQGFSPLGLDDSSINVVSQEGLNIAGHSFGWTAFEIAAGSGRLTITTYGIEAYSAADLANDSEDILAREPVVLSRLVIDPQG